MDDEINCGRNLEELIISWNLDHMLPSLKEENITIDVLKIMNHDQMQELTQKWKVGDKIVFSYNLEKWREKHNIPLYVAGNISKSSLLHPSGSNSPSIKSVSSREYDSDEENKVDVLHILRQNKVGNRILESYQRSKQISNEHRNLIINTIAQYHDNHDISMSLKRSHVLENQILEIFPSEKIEFYRTKQRGKLYTKFHNIKQYSNVFDERPVSSKKQSKKSDMQISDIVAEENGSILAQSLQFDNLSQEEFDATWLACTKFRLKQIAECKHVADITKLWPQYKQENGYKLIDKDFAAIFKNTDSILNLHGDKMLKLYTFLQKNKQIKGREEQKLLETIQTNDIQNDPDLFSLKVLWTLQCYLHPTGRFERKISGGKKEVYRYTSKDSQMSFFYIGNSLQALQEHISLLSTKPEEILPFILGVGELNNITEYFVYTDGTLLAFSSFLRSVDVCFKLFHLFHQQYPKPSETVWSFIEHYIFEINENPINSKVSILINDLQRQTKND